MQLYFAAASCNCSKVVNNATLKKYLVGNTENCCEISLTVLGAKKFPLLFRLRLSYFSSSLPAPFTMVFNLIHSHSQSCPMAGC